MLCGGIGELILMEERDRGISLGKCVGCMGRENGGEGTSLGSQSALKSC